MNENEIVSAFVWGQEPACGFLMVEVWDTCYLFVLTWRTRIKMVISGHFAPRPKDYSQNVEVLFKLTYSYFKLRIVQVQYDNS